MKRSKINAIMRSADEFIRSCGFYLPPFAYWTPADWLARRTQGAAFSGDGDITELIRCRLGWDITDFGLGDFDRFGLILFTLRNGPPSYWTNRRGKPYAEKLMITNPGQGTPMHFHWKKMEDIINRSGGTLAIQLYNSTEDSGLDEESKVTVLTDGVMRKLPAGGVLRLSPGESVTLPTRCYHMFWGEGSRVLIGEVSLVNDDHKDNRFYRSTGRFPQIEEDEAPLHLLVNDYDLFT